MNFIEIPDFITFLRNLSSKESDLHSTHILFLTELSGNADKMLVKRTLT